MEVETLHLAALAFTAAVIAFTDHAAFSYMRGKKETLPPQFVTWSHRLVWVGLISMIVTGGILVYPGLSYYLSEFAFRLKMGFVAMLVINAFFIGALSHVATSRPFASLSSREKLPLILSGAASSIGWIGAAIIGYWFI